VEESAPPPPAAPPAVAETQAAAQQTAAAAAPAPPTPPPAYHQPPPAAAPPGYPPQAPYYDAPAGYQSPAAHAAPPGRNINVQPVQFANFGGQAYEGPDTTNLNLLLDIPLKVTVELGRTQKQIKDILELSQGSIIELDKLAGEPVDILVNNKLIAKGEVVVIDENFGVRVTDIVSQWDRIQKLQ
jgi:flagellar motor switch protein FliN/FliY